jgi:hypothetical protein
MNAGLPYTYGQDFLPNWKNYLPYSLHKFCFAHLLHLKGKNIMYIFAFLTLVVLQYPIIYVIANALTTLLPQMFLPYKKHRYKIFIQKLLIFGNINVGVIKPCLFNWLTKLSLSFVSNLLFIFLIQILKGSLSPASSS